MSTALEIIPANKINKSKWDECIYNGGAIVYATSFYLDHMADNWHGIVLNDYECVLPVPWRQKFAIRYSYEVPFVQQLGWFTKNTFPDSSLLLKTLFDFCKYGDYAFNYNNKITNVHSLAFCNNYILPLNRSHAEIIKGYKQTLDYSLKKASKQNLLYTEEHFNDAIDLYQKLYHRKFLHVSEKDFGNLRKLCNYLLEKKQLIARRVSNKRNETLAATILINFKDRLFNIINNVSLEGRKTEANYFLFDSIFKEFAGNSLLFDFEGSDIPGIKSFYEKFGSVNQPYPKLHFNHLPKVIKWIKH